MRSRFWIFGGLALLWACGDDSVADEGTGSGTPTGSAVGTPTGSAVGTPTGSGTGAPSGTPTGSGSCDVGDCGDCVTTDCATTDICSSELDACVASQACVHLNACKNGCDGDSGCLSQCEEENPSGVALLDAYYECLFCRACPSDCAGAMPCPG